MLGRDTPALKRSAKTSVLQRFHTYFCCHGSRTIVFRSGVRADLSGRRHEMFHAKGDQVPRSLFTWKTCYVENCIVQVSYAALSGFDLLHQSCRPIHSSACVTSGVNLRHPVVGQRADPSRRQKT